MDIGALTLAQIKRLVEASGGPPAELLTAMARDSRSGVRQLYRSIRRRLAHRIREENHLAALFRYEYELIQQGITLVAGVDEAGRGPLAGPVVAAAVILPCRASLLGLDDSKKLSTARRESLAVQIKRMSLDWSVGVATVSDIFSLNIHRASLLAMRRAVQGLSLVPQYLLVDGPHVLDLEVAQQSLVGGDGLSATIAAASILAKVTRDHLMRVCHHFYPQYGFDKHKGYPTPAHLEALARYGPCPLHRVGFRPVQEHLEDAVRASGEL